MRQRVHASGGGEEGRKAHSVPGIQYRVVWNQREGIDGEFSFTLTIHQHGGQRRLAASTRRCGHSEDMFVMSKGHCVETLYAVLAEKGFFPIEQVIKEYSQFGSKFIGHPNNKLPGIEMNSGSLGHGLPVAVGMALAQKMDKRPSRTYVVMGDGELAEGSVWEGTMSATQYKLDNLCAVVDRNRLQISGTTEEVMHQDSVEARFAAFGWNIISVDGNDIDAMNAAFDGAKTVKGKPTLIVANTTKGKGSTVMEDKAGWHHHVPTAEEYDQIIADLKAHEKEAL